MFIKHIIKSFKYQFEYKIRLYDNDYVSADHTNVRKSSNPKNFYVLWSEHNKYTKQNIVKFIICLVSLIGICVLFFADFAYKSEPGFVSFICSIIISCAILLITLCSLGYGYKFGRELYYHYFGWYLILRGIERAGF